MTVNELQEKLNLANEKVTKRLETIKKICKKLEIDLDELIEKYHFTVNNDFEPYYLSNAKREEIISSFVSEKPERDENGNWLDENYHYNFKISELFDNLYKLYEVERVAKNWEIKLQKELNKDNIEKIPIIWDFLTEWEEKSIEWYHKNSELYFELNKKEDLELDDYLHSEKYIKDCMNLPYTSITRNQYYAKENWKRNYYKYIDNFTKQIVRIKHEYNELDNKYYPVSYTVNEEVLKKAVDKEKKEKYFDLVERVTKYIGEINDAKHLSVSPQGELNGFISGKNGKVRIETISAGGYNIQRFHYRVLIHRVKDSL